MNSKRSRAKLPPSGQAPVPVEDPADDSLWTVLPFPLPVPPPPVDPARFLDAARAAFAVGDAHRNPHAETLLFLAERLAEPTSIGLPDPFAPALRVLAQTLYGPSDAAWEKAKETFRRRYLASGRAGDRSPREADAAVRRWQALVDLRPEDRATLHGWCLSQTAGRGPDCACALVTAAAREPLWPVDPPGRELPLESFAPDSLVAAAGRVGQDGLTGKAHDRTTQAIWNGMFGRRLAASRRALPPLFQGFLGYLVTQVGSKNAAPPLTHQVWADDLAAWTGLDPAAVRADFAVGEDDLSRSPAHGLCGEWAVLPDCRWNDFADPPNLEMPWLDGRSTAGQSDGCLWQQVILNRELLPYLRRLCLYLDQMPLTANGIRR